VQSSYGLDHVRQNLIGQIVAVFVVALEQTVEPKTIMFASYLMSAPEPVCDSVRLSPWEELPSSPEQFGHIPNYQFYDKIDCDKTQWEQQSGLAGSVSSMSPTVAPSSLSNIFDSATVPDGEQTADVWLDWKDEAISDFFMDNALKLAGVGQYLPTVSADDVDSLLSSHSTANTTKSDALGFLSWSTPACNLTDYHDEQIMSVSGALVMQVETPVAVPAYVDQVQVASPLMTRIALPGVQLCDERQVASSPGASCVPVFEDQFEIASPPLMTQVAPPGVPVYDEQIQVPSPVSTLSSPTSPESSQSFVSTLLPTSTVKKLRKKEQNKTAAQKYRQKKRGERGEAMSEYEQLERKNIELHTRVDEMTREVNYLRKLIEEICA